jgi:negative regulator of flagellin synthesis FlgM
MTVEFFGMSGIGPLGGVNKTAKPMDAPKTGKAGGSESASFSEALKGAGEVQANSVENPERAARVAELKAQVANGTYEPDLDQVASSLLKFLVENK